MYFFIGLTSAGFAIIASILYAFKTKRTLEIDTPSQIEESINILGKKMKVHLPTFVLLLLLIGFAPYIIEYLSAPNLTDIDKIKESMNDSLEKNIAELYKILIGSYIMTVMLFFIFTEAIYYFMRLNLKFNLKNNYH